MTIHPMIYGTFQVRVNNLMVAEFVTRAQAEAFTANPQRFGYGLIGDRAR